MPEKLWKGRFTERTAQIVEPFTASIDVDTRLCRHGSEGGIAHGSHRCAAILVAVLLAGMLFGCGRKLPPSPPQQFMPPVVADLAFQLEENRVTLSWTVPQLQKDQPAPAGFRIFRARQVSAEADCSACKLEFRQTGDVTAKGKKPGSSLQFRETLLPGYKYIYKVVAYDAKGFDGKESKPIEFLL